MTATATLAMLNLDCADPSALAGFYGAVLDWKVVHSEEEYAMVSGEGTSIGFGRIEGYRPPEWPDTSAAKRFHLDMHVDDLDAAEERCVALGATRPAFQPGGDRWRVLLDPAGHPFCVCIRPGE
ncbi:putative enzyme related to lactoylglutathione lyase [Spinactinospora alkalitolerans]|uniref:Putative enzyme related to lactoylglutathione lyase n=1 Tax=Spinactinospora alkalitolerans TaxID=687207 RepID=A0A852U118_9ACTN|nr:VOC family protein [Spinactinospora alkalitolerans]NYE49811.1 putative enzyme related to lactoylglutathione lyase [Spinactinospora alkalitolerans]